MNQDTKERLMGGAIAFIMILFVWVLCGMVLGAIDASGQTPNVSKKSESIDTSKDNVDGINIKPKCDHITDSFDRFDNIRMYPPALIEVHNAVEKRIYYKITTAKVIKLGSFDIEDDTAIDELLGSDLTGELVLFVFCVYDNHLYLIHKINPKQIIERKGKKKK